MQNMQQTGFAGHFATFFFDQPLSATLAAVPSHPVHIGQNRTGWQRLLRRSIRGIKSGTIYPNQVKLEYAHSCGDSKLIMFNQLKLMSCFNYVYLINWVHWNRALARLVAHVSDVAVKIRMFKGNLLLGDIGFQTNISGFKQKSPWPGGGFRFSKIVLQKSTNILQRRLVLSIIASVQHSPPNLRLPLW